MEEERERKGRKRRVEEREGASEQDKVNSETNENHK